MAGINTEIDALKREIEKTHQSIEMLYMELGEIAGKWHNEISYAPSDDAYEKLCEIIKEKDSVESQMAALRGAVRQAYASDHAIAKTQLSMKDLDNRFNILVASLGAVACEVEADGRLPEPLYRCLNQYHEYEKKLEKLESTKASRTNSSAQFLAKVTDGKIQKLRETLNDVYYDTGKQIINDGFIDMVPGQRAKAVVAEMDEILRLKSSYSGMIKDSESEISKAHEDLRNMGAYGEETKALKALEVKDKQILGQLEIAFTEYGRALAKGINKWLPSEAPKDLRDCCARIKNATNFLMQQNFHMDYLLIERDIDIHKSQRDSYLSQVEHLLNQRDQIDKQIGEIQNRIEDERLAVKDLKQKQDAVSRKASSLN